MRGLTSSTSLWNRGGHVSWSTEKLQPRIVAKNQSDEGRGYIPTGRTNPMRGEGIFLQGGRGERL
eukprot:7870292-Pyramimonas_sp.AAC.1